jgi:hypothetical protein
LRQSGVCVLCTETCTEMPPVVVPAKEARPIIAAMLRNRKPACLTADVARECTVVALNSAVDCLAGCGRIVCARLPDPPFGRFP